MLMALPLKNVWRIWEIKSVKLMKKENIIRFLLLVIAVAFIILGIFNGSAKAVLTKAVIICSECIGLG